ncbi:hypothetical protein JG687_00012006, partial [Phytophthora cactorum]
FQIFLPHNPSQNNLKTGFPLLEARPRGDSNRHGDAQSVGERTALTEVHPALMIILKWLTADRNLQRWRGDTAEDKTKKDLATEIAALIEKTGISGRTYKDA